MKLRSKLFKGIAAVVLVGTPFLWNYGHPKLIQYQVDRQQQQVESDNRAIWAALSTFVPSRNFTDEEESGQVTPRVKAVDYKALPGTIWAASDNMSGPANFVCPIKLDGKPSFIREAEGGFAENRRILYINPKGPWSEFLSKLDITEDNGQGNRVIDPQKVQLWYSFSNWHELGHAFQSKPDGSPTSEQFNLCSTSVSQAEALLNREAGADIFALIGIFRDEKNPTPGTHVWPAGLSHERLLKILIAEREQEPSADHHTDKILRCVNLANIENPPGIGQPEAQATLAFQELANARARAQHHDPMCRQ